VGIKTQLDYHQMDCNYERITNVEQARWWIYSMIHSRADLMLGQINVPKNTICAVEKISIERILPGSNKVYIASNSALVFEGHLSKRAENCWFVVILSSLFPISPPGFRVLKTHLCKTQRKVGLATTLYSSHELR